MTRRILLTLSLLAILAADIAWARADAPQSEPEQTPPPPAIHTSVATWTRYPVPLEPDFQQYVNRLCELDGIDPAIVYAIMEQESGFDPFCVGDGGESIGLMQIYASQHSDRMNRLGVTDLYDPRQNVAVGVDLLVELTEWAERYDRDEAFILMAYNGGISYANAHYCAGNATIYAVNVLARAEELTEGAVVETQ